VPSIAARPPLPLPARRLASRARRRLLGPRNEHFVPAYGTDLGPYLERGDAMAVHHLIRYHWAVAVLTDDPPSRLLDVACGSGYGTRLLASALPDCEIIGADLDPRAIEQSTATPSPANLTFRVGDLERWDATIGPEPFDCVTTFDTLEHVTHRDVVLMNLVDHLTDAGRVLLSTPVRGDGPRLQPEFRHHRIEHSPASLLDLLGRYFRTVRRPDNGTLPHTQVFDQLTGTSVSYLLRMNPLLCTGPIRGRSDPAAPG
jgi:2-polyprenyl-3-methyl-5-hydroxy-6-metoxy-1,4-benzoquinol methylase